MNAKALQPKLPKPPGKLSAESLQLWNDIVGDFELEAHHLALLGRALEQHDRALSARKLIVAEGVTCKDRFGQLKPHPCIDIERNASLAFLRMTRELGLDIEVNAPRGPRRPGTRS